MQTRCADDVGAGGFVGHLGGGWLTKGGEGLVEARARAPRLLINCHVVSADRALSLAVYYCFTKLRSTGDSLPMATGIPPCLVVSAKHGLDLHRWHGGFLRQEQAEHWRNATTCMFLYGAVVTRPCTIGLTLAVGVFVLL